MARRDTAAEDRPHTKAPAKRGGLPIGTEFRFRLDRTARVTIEFASVHVGRLVGGKGCVAKTAANAGKPVCSRDVVDGTLRVYAHPGFNRVRFEGRITGSHKLAPGVLTAVIHATEPSRGEFISFPRRFVIAPG